MRSRRSAPRPTIRATDQELSPTTFHACTSNQSKKPIYRRIIMIHATVGFIVYGVHKDGLQDPMGTPFVDDALISEAKAALKNAGLQLVEHNTVIASKQEAADALRKMKQDDRVDAVILFSGTWVWAAHLV